MGLFRVPAPIQGTRETYIGVLGPIRGILYGDSRHAAYPPPHTHTHCAHPSQVKLHRAATSGNKLYQNKSTCCLLQADIFVLMTSRGGGKNQIQKKQQKIGKYHKDASFFYLALSPV